MEDRDARIESYLNTIDAMGEQIKYLKSKLNDTNSRKNSSQNSKVIDSKIIQSQSKIQQLNQEIVIEREVFRKLTSESESAYANISPEYFICRDLNLIEKLEELTEENTNLDQRKKNLQKQHSRSSSDLMRVFNPKIHFLMKKAIQIEDQNQLYKDLLSELEDERIKTGAIYSKITHALNLDDKVKQRVKELEDTIQNKTTRISKLEEKLGCREQELQEKEYEIANSEVQLLKGNIQNLQFELTEIFTKKDSIFDDIKKIDTEISQEKLRSNVLSPHEAYSKLKEEASRLEGEIVANNKILKLKEREFTKLQIELHEILKKCKKIRPRTSMRPSSQLSTPRMSEYRMTCSSAFTMTQQSFGSQVSDPRRNSLITKIGKEGVTKDLIKTFRTVGKPNQSLGAKIVELNRGLFLTRFNSTPTLELNRLG